MNKHIGWFLALLLCVLCLSVLAEGGIVFLLTDGNPIDGSEKNLAYTFSDETPNALRATVSGLRKVSLDNGYSRYYLEHCIPEGYELFIFGAGDDPRLTKQFGDGITSGEQETLTFDINDKEIREVGIAVLLFLNTKTEDRLIVSFQPFENMEKDIPFELTDGNPIDGSEEILDYTFSDETLNVLRATVSGLRKVSLDNGYSRYYLEHCIPQGYNMFIFGAGDDPRLTKQFGDGITSGEQETLVFDINDNEIKEVGTAVLLFDKSGEDRFLVFISPFN